MSRQEVVTLTDDLSGGKASETITFGIGGELYEIDLNKRNAKALRQEIAEFVSAARRLDAPRTPAISNSRRLARNRSTQHYDPAAVRTWVTAQGGIIATRGRIPRAVVARYLAAHRAV